MRKHIFEDYHEISLTSLTTTHCHLNLPCLQWANQEGQDHRLDPAMFAETRMSCLVSMCAGVCGIAGQSGNVGNATTAPWSHRRSLRYSYE